MDDEIMPKALRNKIIIVIALLFIQSLIFINYINSGIILVLGILFFLLIFSIRNKSLTMQSENQILKKDDSWFKTKYNLSKEIP
jgi:hypothetical protein